MTFIFGVKREPTQIMLNLKVGWKILGLQNIKMVINGGWFELRLGNNNVLSKYIVIIDVNVSNYYFLLKKQK